jgi:ring-1,2-phenylacetyl-CoA epoxidase subunit PaaE
MLEFHPLTVASVEKVADDAVCITLVVPPALQEEFAFHAGQYVPLRRTIDGKEERRTYSIVTAPGGTLLKLGVRVHANGRMSGELAGSLRAGESLEVGSPAGRFRTHIDPTRAFSYVAFAAGSGITPVLSLAADVLAREPASRFTLIYGNRSMSRTMFLEETLALKNRYLGRFAVHFVMSREPQHTAVLNGRIDGAKVHELARQVDGIATAD